jgi:hypothetical protein
VGLAKPITVTVTEIVVLLKDSQSTLFKARLHK